MEGSNSSAEPEDESGLWTSFDVPVAPQPIEPLPAPPLPTPTRFRPVVKPPWELSILHHEIVALVKNLELTPLEVHERREAVHTIRDVAREIWPFAEVIMFGSSATGLAHCGSDLDLVVYAPGEQRSRPPVREWLSGMKCCLQSRRICTKIDTVPNAKVPIVKCVLRQPQLAVDIAFFVMNGPQAVPFIRQQVLTYAPLRELCLVLKCLLGQNGLQEVYTGGIGSYCLLNMIVAHLQKTDVTAQSDLGVLLLGFLRRYGCEHDYRTDVVAIKPGVPMNKFSRNWVSPQDPNLLSVEDPQNPSQDIGKASFRIEEVRALFSTVRYALEANWDRPGLIREAVDVDRDRRHLANGPVLHKGNKKRKHGLVPWQGTANSPAEPPPNKRRKQGPHPKLKYTAPPSVLGVAKRPNAATGLESLRDAYSHRPAGHPASDRLYMPGGWLVGQPPGSSDGRGKVDLNPRFTDNLYVKPNALPNPDLHRNLHPNPYANPNADRISTPNPNSNPFLKPTPTRLPNSSPNRITNPNLSLTPNRTPISNPVPNQNTSLNLSANPNGSPNLYSNLSRISRSQNLTPSRSPGIGREESRPGIGVLKNGIGGGMAVRLTPQHREGIGGVVKSPQSRPEYLYAGESGMGFWGSEGQPNSWGESVVGGSLLQRDRSTGLTAVVESDRLRDVLSASLKALNELKGDVSGGHCDGVSGAGLVNQGAGSKRNRSSYEKGLIPTGGVRLLDEDGEGFVGGSLDAFGEGWIEGGANRRAKQAPEARGDGEKDANNVGAFGFLEFSQERGLRVTGVRNPDPWPGATVNRLPGPLFFLPLPNDVMPVSDSKPADERISTRVVRADGEPVPRDEALKALRAQRKRFLDQDRTAQTLRDFNLKPYCPTTRNAYVHLARIVLGGGNVPTEAAEAVNAWTELSGPLSGGRGDAGAGVVRDPVAWLPKPIHELTESHKKVLRRAVLHLGRALEPKPLVNGHVAAVGKPSKGQVAAAGKPGKGHLAATQVKAAPAKLPAKRPNKKERKRIAELRRLAEDRGVNGGVAERGVNGAGAERGVIGGGTPSVAANVAGFWHAGVDEDGLPAWQFQASAETSGVNEDLTPGHSERAEEQAWQSDGVNGVGSSGVNEAGEYGGSGHEAGVNGRGETAERGLEMHYAGPAIPGDTAGVTGHFTSTWGVNPESVRQPGRSAYRQQSEPLVGHANPFVFTATRQREMGSETMNAPEAGRLGSGLTAGLRRDEQTGYVSRQVHNYSSSGGGRPSPRKRGRNRGGNAGEYNGQIPMFQGRSVVNVGQYVVGDALRY